MEKVIEIHCIRHTYPDKTEISICGLDFVVNKGERVAVLGPNGCGKSTLLRHIVGLLNPHEGAVRVFGCDPVKEFVRIREKIGVVMQNVEEQIIGPTVYDDILFAPLNYGYKREEAERMAEEIMVNLEITHLKNKVPHYLSGGEKKRVSLAGALILKPGLLILDEPFSNLDAKSEEDLLAVLDRIEDITLVAALHDIYMVSRVANVLYLMNRKGELLRGETKELLSQPDLLREYNIKLPVMR